MAYALFRLEVALEAASKKMELKSKVLFAWWGAEEIGLLGSRYFVNQLLLQSAAGASAPFNQQNFLPALNTSNIKIGLNYDMLGSPNYVRYVYPITLAYSRILFDAKATPHPQLQLPLLTLLL